jgi:uncharacterized metal-binding protein
VTGDHHSLEALYGATSRSVNYALVFSTVGVSQVQQISSVISVLQLMQNRRRIRFFATAISPSARMAAASDGTGAAW